MIKDKIITRSSDVVLRNRIYNLAETKFLELKSNIEYIFFGRKLDIGFSRIGDKNSDITISYKIKPGAKDKAKDISLLGSDTLQMIELLLSIVEAKNKLNIIL